MASMNPEYKNRLLRRDDLRQAVMTVIAVNKLDAILYPHQRRLVVPIGEDQVERNGVLSNSTGFPALTFPGGFSRPTPSAPLGVPVGIEILGPDYSEPTLMATRICLRAASHTPPASREHATARSLEPFSKRRRGAHAKMHASIGITSDRESADAKTY